MGANTPYQPITERDRWVHVPTGVLDLSLSKIPQGL